MDTHNIKTVIGEEFEALKGRRLKLFGEKAAANFDGTRFGIALSGGGIRSATINLGFLRTLNLFRILEKADYISTVSGGGYTGAYIQTTIKEKNSYDDLFDEEKISRLRRYGNYLIPGQQKLVKLWNTLMLIVGFVFSWLMSLLGPAAAVVAIYYLGKVVAGLPILHVDDLWLDLNYPGNRVWELLTPLLYTFGSVIGAHLLVNMAHVFDLRVSKTFTKIETVLTLLLAVFLLSVGLSTYEVSTPWAGNEVWRKGLFAFALLAAGFLLNPNALSFHRYYRKQLADAFLAHTSQAVRNMKLHRVFSFGNEEQHRSQYLAPYPLINACLNLQNPGGGDKFKGAKASDYFLLSPFFCGSKLSKYVRTADTSGYRDMTLPAALTISAAAVNPGMGIYSNKMLSILMTLFNARLGFWVNNPEAKPRRWLPKWSRHIVWWPVYFFKELLSNIGTTNRKLNISDGGHIENLAVYELLRRQCRLIIAIDAGADPDSTFADLENLAIRTRNELGVEIRFRKGQDPVEVMNPRPSSGYAQRRYAIADLIRIWEEFPITDGNGNPVTFSKKVKKGKGFEMSTVGLEALVNYFHDPDNPDVFKYQLDLKADRGVDLSEAEFDEYFEKAKRLVDERLLERAHLPGSEKMKSGTLVYVKSSVTPPRKLFVPEYDGRGDKNLLFDTFKYKIYHPDFPHESTADQFFDPVQWESYYQLGQSIAADVLSLPRPVNDYEKGQYNSDIEELISLFDKGKPLFETPSHIPNVFDAPALPEEGALEEEGLEIARPAREAQVEQKEPTPDMEQLQHKIAKEMGYRM